MTSIPVGGTVRRRCLAELVGAAAMAIVSTAGFVPMIEASPVIRAAGARAAWAVPAGGSFVIAVTALACAVCCLKMSRDGGMTRKGQLLAENMLLLSGPVAITGAGILMFLQTMVPLLRATVVMG